MRNREQRVFDTIAASELDALVITTPSNIRWLTGFAGSNGLVVADDQGVVLFTDSRYAARAPTELEHVASSASVIIERAKLGSAVGALLQDCDRVGLEADQVSWNQHCEIDTAWLVEQTVVATSAMIESLRSQKDDAEVARIEAAASIVDSALGSVRAQLNDQPTEREFARSLDAAIRAGGADDLGFATIVASGPNSAIPHHAPTDRQIRAGDLVIVDVGAEIDGYRSDMTRTFVVGSLSADQRLHYETVIDAQQAAVDAMRDGVATAEVDAAARSVISDAGWADAFTHGTGHGVGLDIHELPRVAQRVDDVYKLGTVATVEPGVYLSGIGGVRIEDTCVVTESGARRLTGFPKDPEVL